ncbi:MAG: glutamate-1-semialdehyde 2,1-aminomutase [Candidatus Dormibacteraeota bacterium]|nr:glutamate-1-semialdehyde 2,1-aminomutase [Candidatus Dormibacteraeota bacterium]MBV9526102.1 glutamate-1-semialdehyde 2,1-aminomutase [Candidatus Dormibacteraeota bacterium]
MNDACARALRERAERVLPGGVSSPVRAFHAVPGVPPAIVRGDGAYLFDADGNRYIDCVLAYGPHILGHNPPEVASALREQLQRGVAFGATTEIEVELAERIVDALPSVEMVRFVNSGTEAAMSAVRLARAVTGRDVVVKFDGAYHGHADALLAGAGSGIATLAIPGSPGVPAAAVAATMVLPYNDADALRQCFASAGDRVAALLVEPVAGNMGCVPPQPGFLETARAVTREHGALLVFDEVMSGFRVAYGGAQELYGVMPDLTCLGKVIGGGLPVGAYGGAARVMEQVAPAGAVYQAGTLSGNPLAMAAGCATLDLLRRGDAYARLEMVGERLAAGMRDAAGGAGVSVAVNRVGSMLTPFVDVEAVTDFAGAKAASAERFAALHETWLEGGVLWPPSQFEAGFLSTAHTDSDADRIIELFAVGLSAKTKVRA